MVAVHGPSREGSGNSVCGREETIGILDAALSCQHRKVRFKVVLGLVCGQTESLGEVDGVVKDGSSAQSPGIGGHLVRHGAGARMYSFTRTLELMGSQTKQHPDSSEDAGGTVFLL